MSRRFVLVAVVAVIGCRKAAVSTSPTQETAQPVPALDELARGTYVATISGCVLCHGAMTGGDRTLAGGLEEKEPGGGVWRAPNITPDRDTGIGAWTDAQIITAIRTGVRPDGKKLLPIMPYPFYHRMTDADARAVVVFLRNQKPVKHEVARSEGLALRPVDLPEPTGNVDPTNEPRAHGEYLASLMHCAACHTPQAGPKAGVAFAGGMEFLLPDGRHVVSANITSDPETGIGRWSEAQIIQAIRTMKDPRGNPIEPPMALYRDAWAKLTDHDAQALAVYIKSIAPVHNEIRAHEHAVTRRP